MEDISGVGPDSLVEVASVLESVHPVEECVEPALSVEPVLESVQPVEESVEPALESVPPVEESVDPFVVLISSILPNPLESDSYELDNVDFDI